MQATLTKWSLNRDVKNNEGAPENRGFFKATMLWRYSHVSQCFEIFLLFFCFFLLQPSWEIADPICTFVFSVIVLGTTLAILKDAVIVLMEGKF